MEKFLFLVLMLMLISRLFHAGSHTIILMLMLMLMLVLIAQVGTRLKSSSHIACWEADRRKSRELVVRVHSFGAILAILIPAQE